MCLYSPPKLCVSAEKICVLFPQNGEFSEIITLREVETAIDGAVVKHLAKTKQIQKWGNLLCSISQGFTVQLSQKTFSVFQKTAVNDLRQTSITLTYTSISIALLHSQNTKSFKSPPETLWDKYLLNQREGRELSLQFKNSLFNETPYNPPILLSLPPFTVDYPFPSNVRQDAHRASHCFIYISVSLIVLYICDPFLRMILLEKKLIFKRVPFPVQSSLLKTSNPLQTKPTVLHTLASVSQSQHSSGTVPVVQLYVPLVLAACCYEEQPFRVCVVRSANSRDTSKRKEQPTHIAEYS